jgi:hypothetical protein
MEDQEQEDREQEGREQEDQEQEDQEQEDQEQEDQEQEDLEQEDQEQEDQIQEDRELENQEQQGQEQEDQELEDQEQHGELVNCSQRVASPQDSKVQIDPVYTKESAVLDGDKEALLDDADTVVDENDVSHFSAPVAGPVDPNHIGELSANPSENCDRKYLAAGDMTEMVLVKEDIPSGPRSPQSIPEITEGGDRGSSPILRYSGLVSTVAVIVLLHV